MNNKAALKWWVIPVFASGLFAGCASTPPSALDTKAAEEEPKLIKEKESEEEKRVREWKQKAFTAIESSRNKSKEASAIGALAPETEETLSKAQQAYNAADYVEAVKLANESKRQAEDNMNTAYLGRAKGMLDEARGAKAEMTPEMLSLLGNAEAAYSGKQGKKSYDMANTLMSQLKRVRETAPKLAPAAPEPAPAPKVVEAPAPAPIAAEPVRSGLADSYTVVRGDNLWRIAGKSDIYGNPFQWPLIYKANRDKIKDADLIYPKQQFKIDRSSVKSDVDAAVQHAKTRGAWRIGKVEKKDSSYLAK